MEGCPVRKSSWTAIGAIVLMLGWLGFTRLTEPNPSDEQQIRELLAAGEAAVEQRNMRAALSCVSRDYSDPAGFDRDGLRLQIIQAFRSVDGYDVSLQTMGIVIDGDSAEVRTDISVAAFDDGGRSPMFTGPVTFRLKKEPARRLLVFTTKAWRVSGMSGLPVGSAME